MAAIKRTVAWLKEEPFGVEFVDVRMTLNRLAAVGVAIGSDPAPYRLDYLLETRQDFVTSWLRVSAQGDGWRRRLDLRRSAAGVWTAETRSEGGLALAPPGGDVGSLAGALDCDLGLSPLTNTMPVLRNGLLHSGTASCRVAWVAVPGLSFEAADQRYTYLRNEPDGACIVRFEDTTGFTADISFDADGLVIFYPDLARRLNGVQM